MRGRRCAALRWPAASELRADHVVLALGHSARDTFAMLHERGVFMEAKPFSIGFRIEHPQSLIDRARFGRTPAIRCSARPTTSWCTTRQQRPLGLQLLHVPGRHRGGRDLGAGRVVTNGMSQYSRNERNANAGIVVGITPEDYRAGRWRAPLAGIALQRTGNRALRARRRQLHAPGQLVGDFLARRAPRPRWAGCCRRTSRACA